MIDRIQIEREARAYVARGEWEKAISLYRELLDTKGKDPNIYNLIGDVYVRMDDLADALPEYLTAIDLYEKEGLFENGIAVCKKVIRLNPETGEVYFNLALFYAEIGLLNEAKDSLMTYLRLSPGKRRIEKDPQRYKKLMMLLASDERLKPTIKELYAKIGKKESELDGIFGFLQPEPEEKPPEAEISHPEIKLQPTEEPSIEKQKPLEDSKPSVEPQKSIPKLEPVPANDNPASPIDLIKPAPQPIIEENPAEKQKLLKKPSDESQKQTREMEPVSAKGSPQKPPKSPPLPAIDENEAQILLHAINEISAHNSSEVKKEHYELGIKYKNLGFYDAAIREFQLSTTSNSHRLKALKELGYCFLEKAEPKLAANAFGRAIEEGGKTSEDYIALKYGTGKAYELLGDKENAITSFEEVCLQNINYQDAKERLEKLKT